MHTFIHLTLEGIMVSYTLQIIYFFMLCIILIYLPPLKIEGRKGLAISIRSSDQSSVGACDKSDHLSSYTTRQTYPLQQPFHLS